MKLIFGQGPSLGLRLFFAILLSASLMLADNRLDSFTLIRSSLNNLVSPIHYVSNFPRQLFDNVYNYIDTHHSLVQKNELLKNEVLQLRADLLLLDEYKNDNARLRKLLESPYVRDETKMIAEVMSVNSSTYRQRVLINKGSADGVYDGQPVINEKGIVGQVTNVARHYSYVLLLTDVDSAIPVQVLEKDIRVIASGRDKSEDLYLDNIPNGTNIEPNDRLVSSGLGGVYPEGYPVGIVNKVDSENNGSFSQITVKPAVDFDRLRYLLLVWSNDSKWTSNPTEQDNELLRQEQEIEAQSNVEAESNNENEQQANDDISTQDGENINNNDVEQSNENADTEQEIDPATTNSAETQDND